MSRFLRPRLLVIAAYLVINSYAANAQSVSSAPSTASTSYVADASKEPPAPVAAVAQIPGPGSDYRVGAGDLLHIVVFDHTELASDLRISQSGYLTYPLLGPVLVAGMSSREIESALERGLANGGFIHSPQISVLVVDYQSQKISVMGQVTKPGQYAMTASQKALDLLAEAGGVINMVAADDATLLRHDGRSVPIDLIAMFNGDPSQNPEVGAGDTIYVPRAPQFYVYGEVQRPGVYRLERRMTVSQAISEGGGLTPKGSERRVIVKRRDSKGKERVVSVSTTDILQPDDVLFVKQSLF